MLIWGSDFNYYLPQWFPGEVILPPRGHVAMSGDVIGCHDWEQVQLAGKSQERC